MEQTRIKICGMKRLEDINYVNQNGPDMIGFIFYPPSHRNLSFDEALQLKQRLNPEIKATGVFVDADPDFIIRLVTEKVIDLVQLHGKETEDYLQALRARIPDTKIIKAFVIKTEEDIKAVNESSADYVLADGGLGGGKSFNWDLLGQIKRPYILAGGLSPDNVQDALEKLSPWGVDVSSGVETDKYKSADKIEQFCRIVRAYDSK